MSGTESEQGVPRLPRAESVVTEERAARPANVDYRALGLAADDFARHLAMLEVRQRTGDRSLFAYHLLGRVDWNLSRGMVLEFGETKITIKGRNLAPIFSAIREQKAACLQEADRVIVELAAPAAPVIESIVIETRPAVR